MHLKGLWISRWGSGAYTQSKYFGYGWVELQASRRDHRLMYEVGGNEAVGTHTQLRGPVRACMRDGGGWGS